MYELVNTIFIIMREFDDFEKIQIRSSRADLHHRLGNWNFQMTITYSNFVQTGNMRCFLICTDSTSLQAIIVGGAYWSRSDFESSTLCEANHGQSNCNGLNLKIHLGDSKRFRGRGF